MVGNGQEETEFCSCFSGQFWVSPPMMVAAERDTPGTMARHWKRPDDEGTLISWLACICGFVIAEQPIDEQQDDTTCHQRDGYYGHIFQEGIYLIAEQQSRNDRRDECHQQFPVEPEGFENLFQYRMTTERIAPSCMATVKDLVNGSSAMPMRLEAMII